MWLKLDAPRYKCDQYQRRRSHQRRADKVPGTVTYTDLEMYLEEDLSETFREVVHATNPRTVSNAGWYYFRAHAIETGPTRRLEELWSTDADRIRVLRLRPDAFELMSAPSRAVQLAAVSADPINLQYVADPTQEMMWRALRTLPTPIDRVHSGRCCNVAFPAMQFAKGPLSRAYELAAVAFCPENIAWATEAVQQEAVFADPTRVQYITDPSLAIQMVAARAGAYMHIKRPHRDVALEMARSGKVPPDALDTSDYGIQAAIVARCPNDIAWISDPIEAVQLAAVTYDGKLIRLIQDPTHSVQLAAVSNDGRAIKHLYEPGLDIVAAALAQNPLAFKE